jgi:hypothetical protein
MPHVLVAPDSFKGTFSAVEVAEAIGRGLAAAGLEGRVVDERDTLVALNELWRAAERHGLDADQLWPLSRPGADDAPA